MVYSLPMTHEEQEPGKEYISPENAITRILSRCGVDEVTIISKSRREGEHLDLLALFREINDTRVKMGETGTGQETVIEFMGVDDVRSLTFHPSFKGTDGKLYMVRAIVVSEIGLRVNAAIQSNGAGLEVVSLNPVRMLPLMR